MTIRLFREYVVSPMPTDAFDQEFRGTVYRVKDGRFLVADRRFVTPKTGPLTVGHWVQESQLREARDDEYLTQYLYYFCWAGGSPLVIGSDKETVIQTAVASLKPEAPGLEFWRCVDGALVTGTATRMPMPDYFTAVPADA